MQHSIVYDFLTSKINNFQSKNVFVLVIEYWCAVYESPKIYLEINNLIKRAPKNIHVNLLLITDTDTDTNTKNWKTDTDTDTKKFQDGYGYGCKKFPEWIRIRIQFLSVLRILYPLTDTCIRQTLVFPNKFFLWKSKCFWLKIPPSTFGTLSFFICFP